LNYNVKPSHSIFAGNSLKYNNTSSKSLDSNSFWKSYQGKQSQNISISPSHLLLSPTDNSSTVNLSDFSKVGLSSMKDSSAFKKIQYYSKSPANQLFDSSTLSYDKFSTLNNLYQTSSKLSNSKDYYTDRQDNYTSLLATQLGTNSNLEAKAVDKYLAYNFNLSSKTSNLNSPNSLNTELIKEKSSDSNSSTRLNNTINVFSSQANLLSPLADTNSDSYNINNTTDGKFYNNPLKPLLSTTVQRKPSIATSNPTSLDLLGSNVSNEATEKFSNIDSSSKFKDLKSPNMGFLSADKNARLVSKLHTSKGQFNLSHNNSNLSDICNAINANNSAVSENSIYDSSAKD
jgi:hypothetical protein